MSTKLPPAPDAPDYAAANREGIQTDISTLPLRRQIEAASRLGQSVEYMDPVTGQMTTADFTGLGDSTYAQQAAKLATETNAAVQRDQLALRQELGTANAAQTAAEIRASDPTAYDTRQEITTKVRDELNLPSAQVQPSINIASAENRLWNIANSAPQASNRLGSIYDAAAAIDTRSSDMGALGKLQALEGTAQNRLGTRADDMGTNATLQGLQQTAQNRLGTRADDMGTNATLQELQRAAQERLGTRAEDSLSQQRLGSIYDEATRLPGTVSDPTTAGLNMAVMEAAKDYERGGELDPEIRRQMLNEVRAGQVARGNFLGDGAAVQEALELGAAAEARKAARLGTLLDVQGRAFGQNTQLRGESTANANNRLGQLAGLQAQGFGQNQSLRDEDRGSAASQINSMSGLTQQLFGNNQALRDEDRGSAASQINSLSGLTQQLFGNNQALREEDRSSAQGQIASLSGLTQQLFGNNQSLREEDRSSAQGQIASMSSLAQQLFGNNQNMRQEDRDSAMQQITALAGLSGQQFGMGQAMRTEERGAEMQRLGMLQGIEGQQFGQQQQAYNTGLQAAQTAFQGTQAMANEQRTSRQEGFGYDQQRLANANSVVLGAPLTNQFGSLGGAQQGTVGFTPINYQGGIAQNNNAGNQAAGFAQQSFGTNSNMWNTAANIAQQDNAGKMSMISGAAGAAMGMI